MSEPMFPSSSDVAAPHGAEPAQPGTSNRTALLALGGVVGALVVGGGAFLLLTGGGGGGDATTAAAPLPFASAPAPAASTKPAITAVKTVTVVSRDPFAPLFAAPVPAAPAAVAKAPVTTTTIPQPVAAPTAKVTLSVAAINTTKQTATVSVNGAKYPVAVGTLFAKTFVMYSVFNTQCVGVLFGDQSVPVCTTNPQTVSP